MDDRTRREGQPVSDLVDASGPTSLIGALSKQRRTVVLAGVLAALALWIPTAFGRWEVGVFLAAGIILGLANGVFTELALMRSLESGEAFTRKQFTMTSLVRLMGISVVAIGLTVLFWPNGASVLFGLAIFHLITLVLTGIPLLKELRKA